MATRMPVLFVGHGNPMNAIVDNGFTEAWSGLGSRLPRPRAILCVSAHWYIGDTRVTAMSAPQTIHDFGGFPRELFEFEYPAPGDPALAARAVELLKPLSVGVDHDWGLDHGAWSVLCRMYPEADLPVVQLSIDATRPPEFHYALGKKLGPLREEGVLIVGSGNVVHNLREYAWDGAPVPPFDWAVRFDGVVRMLLRSGDHDSLIHYDTLGPDARPAIPTPDHYLPFLYILGLQQADERITFPVEGFDGGSMSMLAVQIG